MGLIHRLAREGELWGAQRIAAELALLGHDVGVSTVNRTVTRGPIRGSGQDRMNFLKNHMTVTAACAFFTAPTASSRNLIVLVVLSHDRRIIRRVAVASHPTVAWTAQQICQAFPADARPSLLLHDRDTILGEDFSRAVVAMGVQELLSGYRRSWMNCY